MFGCSRMHRTRVKTRRRQSPIGCHARNQFLQALVPPKLTTQIWFECQQNPMGTLTLGISPNPPLTSTPGTQCSWLEPSLIRPAMATLHPSNGNPSRCLLRTAIQQNACECLNNGSPVLLGPIVGIMSFERSPLSHLPQLSACYLLIIEHLLRNSLIRPDIFNVSLRILGFLLQATKPSIDRLEHLISLQL